MSFFQNLKFTARMLRKNPALAATAILATALGIGSTSAMFSITDGILLRPLPFAQADRLVNLWESAPSRNIPRMVAAPANYYDWRAQAQSYAALGAYQAATFNLASGDSEPERYNGAICDPGFFAALRVKPILGRVFTEDENQPDRDAVVVLGFTTWQQRFGADPNVVGRKLDINGRRRVVIGVMPRDFEYPAEAVMWSPLALNAEWRERRDFHRLRVIARLRDGVSLQSARTEMQTIAARLAQQYPDFNADELAVINPILEDLVGTIRPILLVMLGAVAAVLLIACANVANLLLAKASGRQREMAIRISVGAGRAAILGQLLTESVVLAFLGGAAGLALANVALRALIAMAPSTIPRLNEASIDLRAMALAMALSLATGILFGLAPAWFASRVDVNRMLKDGGRGLSSRSSLRSALVAVQVAIAVVLLSGAGLLMRSFYEVTRVDAGFDPQHLMTMRIAPAPVKYLGHPEQQVQLARDILARVSALPGVRHAATASDLPMLGSPSYIMRFEGRAPVMPSNSPISTYIAVTPDFFTTMGMRLIRGRGIGPRDVAGTTLVAVVNQTLVDRYFPNQDPIGKRLEIGFADPPQWRQIVGVVADVKANGLDKDTPVAVYAPQQQMPSFPPSSVAAMTVLARTEGDPARLGPAIRDAILAVDRSQPVFAIQPMTEIVGKSLAQRRLALVLLAFFAASAILLAAIGVYGVISFVVAQRTGEIGIRMALGAQTSQVAWHVQKQGLTLVSIGLGVGLAGNLLVTQYLNSLLFRVPSRDPLVFAIAAGLLLAVSILACWIPARRAARVDPLRALRSE